MQLNSRALRTIIHLGRVAFMHLRSLRQSRLPLHWRKGGLGRQIHLHEIGRLHGLGWWNGIGRLHGLGWWNGIGLLHGRRWAQ